jgi:hypothetical protein
MSPMPLLGKQSIDLFYNNIIPEYFPKLSRKFWSFKGFKIA